MEYSGYFNEGDEKNRCTFKHGARVTINLYITIVYAYILNLYHFLNEFNPYLRAIDITIMGKRNKNDHNYCSSKLKKMFTIKNINHVKSNSFFAVLKM